MIFIVYYFLWFINILLFCCGKKSKVVAFISWFVFFLLFVTNMCLDGDGYKYKMDYELGLFGSDWTEPGYALIKNICIHVGITKYNYFLVIMFIVFSCCFISGFSFFKTNINCLFALSMGFIIPLFVDTTRYFYGLGIFILSLKYLYSRQRIKYALFIVLASLIHRTFIILILFVFFEEGKNRKHYRNFSLFSLIIILIVVVLSCATYALRRLPLSDVLISTLSNLSTGLAIKLIVYFGSITRYGSLLFLPVLITNYLASKHVLNETRKVIDLPKDMGNERIIWFSRICYKYNVYSFFVFPLLIINLAFFRFLAIGSILIAILFGMLISNNDDLISIRFYGKIMFLANAASWLIPAFFGVNSISITNMINQSFLV